MSDRLRRILFAILFVLFTVAVGVAIWFVFFRTPPPSPVTTTPGGGATPGGTLPGAGLSTPSGAIPSAPATGLPIAPTVPGALIAPGAPEAETLLLRDAVTQYASSGSDRQGARYYNPDDSRFYRISTDGVTATLSDQTFPDVAAVTWGTASDQAILEFPDGRKIHYDFRTQAQTTLPSHWEDFSFAPGDSSIVAKSVGVSPDSRFLVTSDPQARSPRAVEALGQNASKTFPTWTPGGQIIAYATVGEAQGLDRQDVILVGQNHENIRALQVEGRGFLPLWSPDGNTVLYSVWSSTSDYRPELWVSGGNPENVNQNRTKLGLQTWADKCVWGDASILYCAVPERLPRGSGLDSTLFTEIPDAFYRVDLRTGAKTFLGRPPNDVSAKNLVVTQDRQHLLFTDVQTGKLYDFRIP